MSKKLYGFISGIIGAVATAASVAVAYFQPAYYGAIIAAIGVATKAADETLLLFVDKEKYLTAPPCNPHPLGGVLFSAIKKNYTQRGATRYKGAIHSKTAAVATA